MRARCRFVRDIAAAVAAFVLAVGIFPGQQAHAKDKALRGELEQALAGQLVTSKIILGDTAMWSAEGQSAVLPVHTLVDAETGEPEYVIEWKFLGADRVQPGDMRHTFAVGTSFRIRGIRIRDDRIDIKLKRLSGESTEVKLMLGKGWQSKYDAATVQARLARVFAFGQPMQQQAGAGLAPPQAEPVQAAAQTATPAATPMSAESPANQPPALPVSPSASPQAEPAGQASLRPAYVDCGALKQLELYPAPQASPSPVAVLQCGEKVSAIGEQEGWVKVRTGQGEEGYLSYYFLRYGEPPSPGQPAGGQPEAPAAVTPGADGSAPQAPPQPAEQQTPAQAAPAGPADSGDESWGWSEYGLSLLLPGSVGLLLVGLVLRGHRSNKEREQELRRREVAQRRREVARLRAEIRQEQREERRRRNRVQDERASAERDYGHVAAQFADLVKACGAQVVEMLRVGSARGGPNLEGKTATDIVATDVVIILGVISNAKGEVPIGLGRLCLAIRGRLNCEQYISVEQHRTVIDDIRRVPHAAHLPYTVMALSGYDQAGGTRLAARAAEAFWALVRAACAVAGNDMGLATAFVQANYLELLRPFLPGTTEYGDGSGQRAVPNEGPENSSSFQGCGECPKYYAVLRVPPTATREEIKTAYRVLAKIYHSDRLQSQEERVRLKGDDLLKAVNEAYDHISKHWSP